MKLENIADKYLAKKFQNRKPTDYEQKVDKSNDNNSNGKNIINIEIDKLISYRTIENEQYEIIAGHNRVEISKELGKTTRPAIIMNVSDEIATLIMIDTNLCGRDDISPIDKGRAYKLKLETIKKVRQQMLEDKDSQAFSQDWEKYSIDKLMEESNESKSQIYRYISLTSLILEFQKLVTDGIMSISVASEVATLNEEQQEILYTVLDDKRKKLKVAEIQKIKTLQELTYNNIVDVLENKKIKKVKFTGKLNKKIKNKYKDKFDNDNDFTNLIDKLLEEYFDKVEQSL